MCVQGDTTIITHSNLISSLLISLFLRVGLNPTEHVRAIPEVHDKGFQIPDRGLSKNTPPLSK